MVGPALNFLFQSISFILKKLNLYKKLLFWVIDYIIYFFNEWGFWKWWFIEGIRILSFLIRIDYM